MAVDDTVVDLDDAALDIEGAGTFGDLLGRVPGFEPPEPSAEDELLGFELSGPELKVRKINKTKTYFPLLDHFEPCAPRLKISQRIRGVVLKDTACETYTGDDAGTQLWRVGKFWQESGSYDAGEEQADYVILLVQKKGDSGTRYLIARLAYDIMVPQTVRKTQEWRRWRLLPHWLPLPYCGRWHEISSEAIA